MQKFKTKVVEDNILGDDSYKIEIPYGASLHEYKFLRERIKKSQFDEVFITESIDNIAALLTDYGKIAEIETNKKGLNLIEDLKNSLIRQNLTEAVKIVQHTIDNLKENI